MTSLDLGYDQFPLDPTTSTTTGAGSAHNSPDTSRTDFSFFAIYTNNEHKCGTVSCTYHEVGCSSPIAASGNFQTSYITNVVIGSTTKASTTYIQLKQNLDLGWTKTFCMKCVSSGGTTPGGATYNKDNWSIT